MADVPIYSDKDLFEQGAAGLVSTLALVAANTGAPLPVQGAMAMVAPLLGLGFGRSVYRAATRRYPLFARGFLNALDPDPAVAGEKAKTAAELPLSEDLDTIMMRSFRAMMEAVDEWVVPVLGYMAGVYTFTMKKPDPLFRGLGRVLCDLEAGELEELSSMIRLANTAKTWGMVPVNVDADFRVWADGNSRNVVSPNALRLVSMLKREGLAGNQAPGQPRWGTAPDGTDRTLSIEMVMAKRMIAILDPMWTGELPVDD